MNAPRAHESLPGVQVWSRSTPHDGTIVEFATGFRKLATSPLGTIYERTGPFLVTATRAGIALRGEAKTVAQMHALQAALQAAWVQHRWLARHPENASRALADSPQYNAFDAGSNEHLNGLECAFDSASKGEQEAR